jgi:hypothetical protein
VTERIRDALRALAVDEPSESPVETIETAIAALDDVRTLAAFVDDDGPERLRRAVAVAERNGDTAAARRGRRALATIDRCRTAAADQFHSGHGTVLSTDDQSPDR